MEYKKLGEINKYVGKNINPLNVSEEVFEMYSVPSFDKDYPEIIKGEDIGSSKQLVQKDDILLCKINPRINRVWIVSQFTDNKAIASSEWIVIRNRDMCARYLMWYFRSDYFRTLMISNVTGMGGSLMRAQPKQVQEYLVPVIDYDKQIIIAKVLDKAQELIYKRKRQIEELDELVKSRFIEMFGEYFSEEYIDELMNVSNKITDGEHGTVPRVDTGIPYLMARNITINNTLDFKEVSYIEEKVHDKIYLRCNPECGDLLIVCVGATIGKVVLVPKMEPFSMARSVALVKYNRDVVNGNYLLWLFNHNYMKSQLKNSSNESAQAGLYIGKIKKLKVPVPPIELQNQFADFVKQVDKLKFEMEKSLKELEENFNSLMQKAFKGELFD